MAVRFLAGTYDGYCERVCLVDSVTETAFGPLFVDLKTAEDFVAWLPHDARAYSDGQLERMIGTFLRGENPPPVHPAYQ